MFDRLKRLLPTPESVRQNRWLRWMGPVIHHPRLWHFSRKGISAGLAIGIFFGLLIPIAQIPFSAVLAVVLRANLPVAIASTLVTNPVTFGPLYYGAYHLGRWVLGESGGRTPDQVPPMQVPESAVEGTTQGFVDSVMAVFEYATTVGKPLVVGLAILAVLCGLAVYWISSAVLAWRVRRQRQQRLRARLAP
ncbi:MAG: DUF2062 domain-containing protein [Gammaproteobacteria bacterium]